MQAPSPFPPLRSVALIALAMTSVWLGGGCAASREPLRPPELISFVTYYGGDPVAGPMDEGAAVSLPLSREDAVRVSMELRMTRAPIP